MARRVGYREVARALAALIADGTYPQGSYLPSQDVLCRTYGIGTTTAERVVGLLRHAGLVDSESGMLTRVRVQPERRERWLRPGTRVITRMPTFEERDELGIPDGVPVHEVYHRHEFELVRADEVELVFE
jgi:DNA-binding GntR family transcriptional regulator